MREQALTEAKSWCAENAMTLEALSLSVGRSNGYVSSSFASGVDKSWSRAVLTTSEKVPYSPEVLEAARKDVRARAERIKEANRRAAAEAMAAKAREERMIAWRAGAIHYPSPHPQPHGWR